MRDIHITIYRGDDGCTEAEFTLFDTVDGVSGDVEESWVITAHQDALGSIGAHALRLLAQPEANGAPAPAAGR